MSTAVPLEQPSSNQDKRAKGREVPGETRASALLRGTRSGMHQLFPRGLGTSKHSWESRWKAPAMLGDWDICFPFTHRASKSHRQLCLLSPRGGGWVPRGHTQQILLRSTGRAHTSLQPELRGRRRVVSRRSQMDRTMPTCVHLPGRALGDTRQSPAPKGAVLSSH